MQPAAAASTAAAFSTCCSASPTGSATTFLPNTPLTVGINGYKEAYPIRAVRDIRYKFIRNLFTKPEAWQL
jgi:hypothetical protein